MWGHDSSKPETRSRDEVREDHRGQGEGQNDLARAMVAQSEQAFLAIAQGNAPRKATAKILEYSDMAPFFIKVECDDP